MRGFHGLYRKDGSRGNRRCCSWGLGCCSDVEGQLPKTSTLLRRQPLISMVDGQRSTSRVKGMVRTYGLFELTIIPRRIRIIRGIIRINMTTIEHSRRYVIGTQQIVHTRVLRGRRRRWNRSNVWRLDERNVPAFDDGAGPAIYPIRLAVRSVTNQRRPSQACLRISPPVCFVVHKSTRSYDAKMQHHGLLAEQYQGRRH